MTDSVDHIDASEIKGGREMILQQTIAATVLGAVFLCPAAFASQTGTASTDAHFTIPPALFSSPPGEDFFSHELPDVYSFHRSPPVEFVHTTIYPVMTSAEASGPLPGDLLAALAEGREKEAVERGKRPRSLSQSFREEESNHHPLELEIEGKKGEKKEKPKEKDDANKDEVKKDDVKKADVKKLKKDFGDNGKDDDGNNSGKTHKKDANFDRKDSKRFKKDESRNKDDKRKLLDKVRQRWTKAG